MFDDAVTVIIPERGDTFANERLAGLVHALKQILKALPKMAKAASHEELKEGFQEHLEQTREHVDRLLAN